MRRNTKLTPFTWRTEIIRHYESCLHEHGDTHRGVNWPNQADAETRYGVMMDLIKNDLELVNLRSRDEIRLLDFGCGASHLYEYLQRNPIDGLRYSGLDLSKKFIELSRSKFPDVTYYCLDVLDSDAELPEFDYVVFNGVFTEKRGLSFDEMLSYFQRIIERMFRRTRIAIAFNVMSVHVDWTRDDLFHVPFDVVARFVREELSRHFVFRFDYGLYEYTTYVHRDDCLTRK